ncbi:DUF4214 domain-containing protein [Sulfuricurvum sp.]|uniref:DUF4214 domain-containing protein n=1 Tax=Sulfuricurvum sp. TaxID=2025608 RepID=UPI00262AA08A|nr:DUF4214 domain-containing protein [Sulfuricurvum sp.]MDD2266027.1 DUF4214 domain-containing protein [Sulfuricurvum sp.]MDD2783039.1 DUF4214 domain-containing protein [Sulfuricurvum sp.]
MSLATLDNVAKLYVATFNRAPDAAGLDYWVNSGMSLEDISQSFFDQPETQNLYPIGTQTTVFVTSVYQNLFNRPPDQAGLDYWANELNTHTISNQNFILAVTNGALGSDATILTNKTTIGLAFANAGLNDPTFAHTVMANVDASEESVTSAEDTIIQNTPVNSFYFTEEWLSGRTLYDISGDQTDGAYTGTPGPRDLKADIMTMIFDSNGTLHESMSPTQFMEGTWNVDNNHTIVINDSWGTWYMRASGETIGNNDNSYVVYVDNNYTGFSANSWFKPEAITTDHTIAVSLVGTILPAQNVFETFA